MRTSFASSLLLGEKFIPVPLDTNCRVGRDSLGVAVPDERDTWCVIAPAEVRLHPGFQNIFLQVSLPRPDVGIFYGDEVVAGNRGSGHDIIVKPDLDIALLIAVDYIGLPLIVRASA